MNISNWEELRTKYKKLHDENPPYPYNRDEIEQASEKAIQARTGLNANSHTVLSNMIIEAFTEIPLQAVVLNQNENLFSGPLLTFRQDVISLPHLVVFDKEFKRQILITSNVSSEILDKHKDSILDTANNHLVILTNPEETKSNWKRGIMSVSLIPNKGTQRNLEKLKSWLETPIESENESVTASLN